MNGSCSNSRSITRAALETRARLMAPEIAADAKETNHLNRERRAGSEADRKALSRPLMTRLRELEAKQDELTERLSRAPARSLPRCMAIWARSSNG